MARCPFCGEEVDESWNCCIYCGTRLKEEKNKRGYRIAMSIIVATALLILYSLFANNFFTLLIAAAIIVLPLLVGWVSK